MRKLFLSAVMMIMAAIALPSMAQAAVSCANVQTGGFPGGNYTQYCTGTTQSQGEQMFAPVNSTLGQQTVTTLRGNSYSFASWLTNEHVLSTNYTEGVFYLFNTQADFLAWAPSHLGTYGVPYPAALANDVDGFTQYPTAGTNANKGPGLYTVIFATISGKPNLVISTTTAHEIGHYMDWLFAHTAGSTDLVSNSADWQAELTKDWAVLNTAGVTPCATASGSGVFSYKADDTNIGGASYYICNGFQGAGMALNPKYAGSNETIIQAAWPYFYKKGSEAGNMAQPWKELFAEEYGGAATLDGQADFANDPSTADWYLGYGGVIPQSGFACTRAFTNYLVQQNAIPKAANPPGNWPAGCPLF
jgi:hypothetical protein